MPKQKKVKESTENPVEQKQPTVEDFQNDIVSKVVSTLSPELNNAVQMKFEEMKTVFMNELKDIRSHFEQNQTTENQPQQTSITQLPQDMTEQQQQSKAGLESILPLVQMISGTNNNNGGLGNMFMEALMRKSLADITRGDMMNELMLKSMYKKLLGSDLPDDVLKTTDSLMSPLRKFGANQESSNK